MTDEEKKNWDAVYGPINEKFEKDPPKGDDLTRWKYQRYMQDYLACIGSVDDNVGRLLDYLDKMAWRKIPLWSIPPTRDFIWVNMAGSTSGLCTKNRLGHLLMVRWPGKIKRGAVNTDLVQNLDFAETFLDAAGVTVPGDMQGQSMLPLFNGETTTGVTHYITTTTNTQESTP